MHMVMLPSGSFGGESQITVFKPVLLVQLAKVGSCPFHFDHFLDVPYRCRHALLYSRVSVIFHVVKLEWTTDFQETLCPVASLAITGLRLLEKSIEPKLPMLIGRYA